MSYRLAAHARAALLLASVLTVFAGCGEDDDRAGSISLQDWVHQFDAVCEAVTVRLEGLGPGMSDAELAAFTVGSVTTLGALPPPDEQADIAATLLDDIEAGQQPGLDQATIDELDERILTAMTTLGISDTCIGGIPG